jgi:hypothetical protein
VTDAPIASTAGTTTTNLRVGPNRWSHGAHAPLRRHTSCPGLRVDILGAGLFDPGMSVIGIDLQT